MLDITEPVKALLAQRSKYIVPVVEFYPRETLDLVSINAPAAAVGRFAQGCFDWETSAGTYRYEAKVMSWDDVQSFIDERINSSEITFSNLKRGEGSMARFALNNHVKGMWMVVRLVYPTLTDESTVLFWGKCDRPGGINNEQIVISSSQDLGNHGQKIPFRTYGVHCPLEFAKEGGDCLGNQTLAEKSLPYRQAVMELGTAGCNKLFTTCTLLGNTNYFQGQRVVAVSGQFSYVTIEEVVKRVLFWTKRKKVKKTKVENWSSVNQSEESETVPLGFGRFQIEGHPFVWADTGTQVKALYGFCEGKISAFTFTRSRTEGINIVQRIEHLGDWGGLGTQQPDTLFNGSSGVNSRLAYQEIITDGSQPTQVDDAPIITSVIRGLELPVPDAQGAFTLEEWSNNPVAITRYVLTNKKFGKIPTNRIDDEVAYDTFLDCDEIVEDRSNEETIVLPSNEFANYDVGYRRFRSAGRYSAYKDLYVNGDINPLEEFPEFEDPEIRWFNPFEPFTVPVHQNVLRQKYTANGAIQEETSIFDFLMDQLLPTFKGYINYGFNGKIQIKNRRKADNAYVRNDLNANESKVPVTTVAPWRYDAGGYLVVGVSLEEAEVRTVTGFEYSTAGNDLPMAVTTSSDLTATVELLSGGSASRPALGYIQISGVPITGSWVSTTFESGDDAYTISYTADGVETEASFARMYAAFLNANPQFHSYLTAYILPSSPNKIQIRCDTGYLVLNKALQYQHFQGEEVLRVQMVFENCSELTANQSAQFDNIIENSFQWNEQDTEEINAITAKYTSAVDDFRDTILMPRAAWDTIDLEGELVKEELDLRLVDNYWQAAYLAKGEAIDRIDGNIHFKFQTSMPALGLELGDVIAVRHDSGDGALNYVPAWVTEKSIDLNEFKINIGCKLYLTAAFDYHVAPIDALLTTTLNTDELPEAPPPTIGTSGGVGSGSEPVYPRASHNYYEQFQGLGVYSPSGQDIV